MRRGQSSEQRRGYDASGFDLSGDLKLSHDPLGPVGQIIFPLLDIIEFGVLVAAGFFYRRRAAIHKRIMLFATLAMLPAPFAHP
jgi:hypothetical protein